MRLIALPSAERHNLSRYTVGARALMPLDRSSMLSATNRRPGPEQSKDLCFFKSTLVWQHAGADVRPSAIVRVHAHRASVTGVRGNKKIHAARVVDRRRHQSSSVLNVVCLGNPYPKSIRKLP